MKKIQWTRADYITLGRAVSDFNKKIKRLESEEIDYLPEQRDYKEVKENIKTRKELEKVLASLRSFKQKGAEELYKKSAEPITKWEYQETQKEIRAYKAKVRYQLKKLGESPKNLMGNGEEKTLKAELQRVKSLYKRKGKEYQELKKEIEFKNSYDYKYIKALYYQENFMNELKGLAEVNDDFQIVYDYFKGIKDPIGLFNIGQRSQAIQDFFDWYKKPEDYAGFNSKSELANYILKEYGIEAEIENQEKEKFTDKYDYVIIEDGKIIKRSNNLYSLIQAYNKLKKEGRNVIIYHLI